MLTVACNISSHAWDDLVDYYEDEADAILDEYFKWLFWLILKQSILDSLAMPEFQVKEDGLAYHRGIYLGWVDAVNGLKILANYPDLGYARAEWLDPGDCLGGNASRDELSYWNSGEVIFVRRDDYMEKAETRRKMRFIGQDGQRVKVTYAFPVRRRALNAWKAIHGQEFYEVQPTPGQLIYAMSRSQVNQFVAVEYSRGWGFLGGELLQSDNPPDLLEFNPDNHVIKIFNSGSGCCELCWSDFLDFCMSWEVIITDQPINQIIGEDVPELPD